MQKKCGYGLAGQGASLAAEFIKPRVLNGILVSPTPKTGIQSPSYDAIRVPILGLGLPNAFSSWDCL